MPVLRSLLGIALVVVIGPPLGSIAVLAWAWRTRVPWRDLGLVRPRSWRATIALGVVAGVGLKLLMKTIVMPLLGAPAINPTYHFLVGNAPALPGMMFNVIVGAGIAEEIVYRGFLFERLGRLLGSGARARAAIVVLTALLFGLVHLPGQGVAGAQQATLMGLVVGSIYATTGSLGLPMVLHAAFDVAAVSIIYLDLEARLAHLFFR
jgi:membrane protease YdiL (CAAX protease family)